MSFKQQRILITGGSSGIGLAGAQQLAREGAELIVTGRNPQHLAEAARLLPGETRVLRSDNSEPDDLTALVECVKQTGPLDGLWLNAGYAAVAPCDRQDKTFFDAMMSANVRGPVLQLAALSAFLKPGAAVVVTASSSAYEGAAATSIYAATKAALIALTRCWATELAARQIRVNCLVPGPISSELRSFLPVDQREEFEQGVLAQVPLARIGRAEEAAAVALFLLSSAASYVTGSQYCVDGGLLMR